MSTGPVNTDQPFSERFFDFIRQFAVTLLLHKKAYDFIKEHRPWEGLQQYGWTAKVLIAAAVIFGLQFFYGFYEMVSQAVEDPTTFGASINAAFADFDFEKFNWMLQGGRKYLVLIVLEIVTFHFVQRTLEIRMGREPERTFGAFLKAQKRMVAVSFISWVMENIVQTVVNIPLGIFGLDFLEQAAGLAIQFFFLGFAMIDNYHECFHLKVTESRKRTWRVSGVAIATGAVAYVLMFIPLAGVVVASMLGAVTAVMAMERFLPITDEEMLAYEMARAEKKKK
ncbi:MAG: hypothetical protein H6577_00590 [Lewinellaceae bacterium]|nr:hypothetical protein [Saprospiraceae bacterium]MCB9336604.1 hypothetical protein [Lewinellaceae bacterium]